jgi:hypothetical protein
MIILAFKCNISESQCDVIVAVIFMWILLSL